jgi:hypothetical protein
MRFSRSFVARGGAAFALTQPSAGGTASTRSPFCLERLAPPLADEWRPMMLDAMYLAIGFGFLVVAVLYVTACDRL